MENSYLGQYKSTCSKVSTVPIQGFRHRGVKHALVKYKQELTFVCAT